MRLVRMLCSKIFNRFFNIIFRYYVNRKLFFITTLLYQPKDFFIFKRVKFIRFWKLQALYERFGKFVYLSTLFGYFQLNWCYYCPVDTIYLLDVDVMSILCFVQWDIKITSKRCTRNDVCTNTSNRCIIHVR